MSDHAHDTQHDDDPWSHVPPPSFWPFLVGVGLVLLVCTNSWMFWTMKTGQEGSLVWPFAAGAFMLAMLMGWAHQVIKEKPLSHDPLAQQNDLKLFVKMFLLSEFAAFGAIFSYYYLMRLTEPSFAPPSNLHLGGTLVAIATFILLSSSVTCEFAHHAIAHGKRGQARLLLLTTIGLGVMFLGFQGYEYGELITWGFGLSTSAYSSTFFIGTGFHGVHVLTGLVMLCLVWLRMEMGHYDGKRHASLIAASWYWHFVDIVWILLFISVYVV